MFSSETVFSITGVHFLIGLEEALLHAFWLVIKTKQEGPQVFKMPPDLFHYTMMNTAVCCTHRVWLHSHQS